MGKITALPITDPVTPLKLGLSFANIYFLLNSGKVDKYNFYELSGTYSYQIIDKIIDCPETSKPFEGEIIQLGLIVHGDLYVVSNEEKYRQIEHLCITNADGNTEFRWEIIYVAPNYRFRLYSTAGALLAYAIMSSGNFSNLVPVASTVAGYIKSTSEIFETVAYDASKNKIYVTNRTLDVYGQYKKIANNINSYEYTVRNFDVQLSFRPGEMNGQLVNSYEETTIFNSKESRKAAAPGAVAGALIGAAAVGLPGIGAIIGAAVSERGTKKQTVRDAASSFIKTATMPRPEGYELVSISPMGELQIQIADKGGTEGNSAYIHMTHSISESSIVFRFDLLFAEGRKLEDGEFAIYSGSIQTFWRRKI